MPSQKCLTNWALIMPYGKLREKMNRIKVLRNQPNMVENEGLEDALLDTAGYAILTLVELKKRKGQ